MSSYAVETNSIVLAEFGSGSEQIGTKAAINENSMSTINDVSSGSGFVQFIKSNNKLEAVLTKSILTNSVNSLTLEYTPVSSGDTVISEVINASNNQLLAKTATKGSTHQNNVVLGFTGGDNNYLRMSTDGLSIRLHRLLGNLGEGIGTRYIKITSIQTDSGLKNSIHHLGEIEMYDLSGTMVTADSTPKADNTVIGTPDTSGPLKNNNEKFDRANYSVYLHGTTLSADTYRLANLNDGLKGTGSSAEQNHGSWYALDADPEAGIVYEFSNTVRVNRIVVTTLNDPNNSTLFGEVTDVLYWDGNAYVSYGATITPNLTGGGETEIILT